MTRDALHSSATVEHFTPEDVVEAEHDVLGFVELDPASCATANRVVRARRIYTREQNGYRLPLRARTVHLNPPGGLCDAEGRAVVVATTTRRGCKETGACGLPPGHAHVGVTSAQKAWWFKLARAFVRREFESAVFVCFNVELLQNAQVDVPLEGGAPLPHPLDFSYCFPAQRLRYASEGASGELVEGGSPTHSSAIFLLTRSEDVRAAFRACFSRFGRVW